MEFMVLAVLWLLGADHGVIRTRLGQTGRRLRSCL